MSDVRETRLPVEHIPLAHGDWFTPGGNPHPYAFIGGDCPVLQRAISRWGVITRHELASELIYLLDAPVETEFVLGNPTEHEYPVREYQRTPLTVPVFYLEDRQGPFLPATAVYYTLRRFGEEGQWSRTCNGRVFRYDLDGEPVALIGVVSPPELN